MLDSIVIETAANPTAAVIWLHGLGADGNDFAPVVPQFGLTGLAVRFIFPHAPKIAVTINNGYVMRAWYDIMSADLTDKQDAKGVQASQIAIEDIIRDQIHQGIDANHIILAGFSQGGAIALYTGLRYSETLAGIIALSTYLPLAETTQQQAHKMNRGTPIFMAHGQADPVIPMSAGIQSKKHLESLGYSVKWFDYPMEHSVHPDEILQIGQWIKQRISSGQ